jgi:hypothetical protein
MPEAMTPRERVQQTLNPQWGQPARRRTLNLRMC